MYTSYMQQRELLRRSPGRRMAPQQQRPTLLVPP
jgi:hypothetical protein